MELFRAIAVDYGSKRVGLAVSDGLGITAQSLPMLPFAGDEKLIAELKRLAEEKGASVIVLGLPRNMDGSIGPKAEECQRLAEKIRAALGLHVELVDERLTTRQADRLLTEEFDLSREKRKGLRDSMAAAILLQSYLDSRPRSS